MGIIKLSPVEKSLLVNKYGDVKKAREKINSIEKELKQNHSRAMSIERAIPKEDIFKESFIQLKQKYKNIETFKNK